MKLRSIEPTPNPNSMKLNLDESLPKGTAITYKLEAKDHYPDIIRRLLEIPGVKSLYRCLDFISIQRLPSTDWEGLLSRARHILAAEGGSEAVLPPVETELPGEVKIFVQHFRRIPMLVKVQAAGEEFRAPLPARFAEAVRAATPSSPNMLIERKWIPREPRFGELQDVGETMAAEVEASYPQARLDSLVLQAFELGMEGVEVRRRPSPEEQAAMLASEDWRRRYQGLEAMGSDRARFAELTAAMKDPHISMRRLATIYVGLLKTPEILAPLCEALRDSAAVVRRTAGDALNDLGDPAAAPAMIEALKDANKLVRWRASRFLYELGDAKALPALHATESDPEFEIRLQVAQAIERIEGGKDAAGPIWMQMTRKSPPEAAP
ncbi:MAG: virulence factor [Fibrobacterota bacterium]|nr:virulence factor [Fibrobacterota bacterium]